MFKDADRRREYDREYHAKRSAESKIRKQELKYERMRVVKEYVDDIKRQNPCACGESHIACLDFHHERDKEINISDALRHV